MTARGLQWVIIFSFGGTLFAGYLSVSKLFTDTCPFNESCPYFLGYPACWYGLTMFAAMLVISIVLLVKKEYARGKNAIMAISVLGIIFSGYFVYLDAVNSIAGLRVFSSSLGLPTCVYGLVFYVAIFFCTMMRPPKQETTF